MIFMVARQQEKGGFGGFGDPKINFLRFQSKSHILILRSCAAWNGIKFFDFVHVVVVMTTKTWVCLGPKLPLLFFYQK